MKRLLSGIVAFIMLALLSLSAHAEGVGTSARAFVLYCANNGEVLSAENPDEKLPMASTTKLMTTLLTLEAADKDNKVVEFTEEMTAEGSSMYLKVGEKVTLYDLAVGMMMQSGNDAANAAAIALAGSVEGFASMMNEKAAEIGMKNTHFVTPSGLDDDAHYSTARDMATLMAYALGNGAFREMTAQTSMTVDFVEPEDKRVTYPNHNRLLNLYDSCIGGKTGYTMTAGRCLVTAAERDGLTLVAVTLDDRDDWDDHMALFDYGFEHYAVYAPDNSRDIRVDVVGGVGDEAAVYTALTTDMVVPRDRLGDIEARIFLSPFLYAPVGRGDIVGEISYTLDGKSIGKSRLLSADNIAYNSRRRGFFEYLKDVLGF